MSWVDWAIGGVLALFAIQGLTQGLIRQITSFGGFLAGLLFAFLFTSYLAIRLSWYIGPNFPTEPLAFAIIFLGTWIGVNLLGFAMRHRKRARGAGQTDEIAGALVGFVLGTLILAILAMGIVRMGVPLAQDIQASKMGAWLLVLGERLGAFLP
jgi:uncharacterized membrane protein required for colicin V production